MWQAEISNYGSFLAKCFHLKMKKLLETSPFYARVPKATIYEVRFLRYKVRQFFVILGNFFPFTPLTTHKIKMLKKWRKHLEKSSFYTCVPKIKVMWCMLPEIWSVTGTTFYQFKPLFCPFTLTILKIKIWKKKKKNTWGYYLFTKVHHKWRSYDVWFLRYKGVEDRVFCHFKPFFPFDPPNNPKNQKSSFTLVYHKQQYMMDASWDMECNRHNFLSFWVIFCPLTLPP